MWHVAALALGCLKGCARLFFKGDVSVEAYLGVETARCGVGLACVAVLMMSAGVGFSALKLTRVQRCRKGVCGIFSWKPWA